jgi:hypothetical protein
MGFRAGWEDPPGSVVSVGYAERGPGPGGPLLTGLYSEAWGTGHLAHSPTFLVLPR